jgi:hypothetical protein
LAYLLSVAHAFCSGCLFRMHGDATALDVLESYEEYHVADVWAMELAAMSPDAERFGAKTTVLIENVTHRIKDEERTGLRGCASGWARKAAEPASGYRSSVRSCWRRSSVRRIRRLGPAR